jgi:hypothetical protein
MPDETNGDQVPAPGSAVAAIPPAPPLLALLGTNDRLPVCSFDLKSVAGRQLLQKCEEEPDTPVREMANMQLRLQHVYAKVIDYTNQESDEVYPLLRICLITTEGKVHACCADGVRESLLRLMAGHGLPPWKDGIPVEIRLKATKKGFNRLTLLEVFDAPKGGKAR